MSDPPTVLPPDPLPPLPPFPTPDPAPPPTLDVLIQISDRLIIGWGHLPSGTDDPDLDVVAIDAGEQPKLEQPGDKYLTLDGIVVVVPLGIDYAGIAAQRRAAEAQGQAELLSLYNPDYLVILKTSGGIA